MFKNPELLINNLCTQKYHIEDNFLDSNHFVSLRKLGLALYQSNQFHHAKIGLKNSLHSNLDIRTDQIIWIEEDNTNADIQCFTNIIKDFTQLLNKSLFLGIQEIEMHYATYLPGTYYRKHRDQFKTQKNRIISFVFYLNENWQEHDGGILQLYNSQDHIKERVIPQRNRFVCFCSDLVHEVSQTIKTRLSIAGWLKTRI